MERLTVEQLVDLEEIRRLKARYARFLDEQDWASWRSVFAEDCVLEWPTATSRFDEIVGPEAIMAFLRGRIGDRRTSHQYVTPEIEFNGPHAARGTWLATVVQTGNRRGYGYYRDTYCRIGGRWLLQRFRFDILFTEFGDDAASTGGH